MSEESIGNIAKSGSSFAPTFVDHHVLADINFDRHCLVKKNIFIPEKVINLYISYTLGLQLRNLNTDFTLCNCLFGSVNLTKNADLDKYKNSEYGIGFDSGSEFSLSDDSIGKNVNIFGADKSWSVHVNNKRKGILILNEGPTQALDDMTLTAEAKYSINYKQSEKKFVLSLNYKGNIGFLFVIKQRYKQKVYQKYIDAKYIIKSIYFW